MRHIKEIYEELNKKIDHKVVKQRETGADYIDHFAMVDTANKIFGVNNWTTEVEYKLDLFERDHDTNQVHVVYTAKCKATVHYINIFGKPDSFYREDVGCGAQSGQISRGVKRIFDTASKEAATDAMKRAVHGMGYPLGLALYDKKKRHIDFGVENIGKYVEKKLGKKIDPDAYVKELPRREGRAVFDAMKKFMDDTQSEGELDRLKTDDEFIKLNKQLPKSWKPDLKAHGDLVRGNHRVMEDQAK